MAATKTPRAKGPAKATQAAKPKGDGADLYKTLLARAKQARIGEIVEHKGGLYARVTDDARTLVYIVKGKTVATVYPNALARDVPDGVTFRQVELGSHHYGRGEIVVTVSRPEDVDNAVAMVKASAKMPAIPKTAKAPAPAAEGGDAAAVADPAAGEGESAAVTPNSVVVREAKPDPKKKAGQRS